MPDISLSVPTSENEVTKEWLQAVLASSFPGSSITSLVRKRIGEAYGFASRIFRCQWQDDGVLQSVVVKLWDTESKAGFNEVLFYQTFRDVGARIPRCFYSALDPATKKAALVLEDIKETDQGDALKLVDLERAQGIAISLARLHSAWLDHPKLTQLSWISDLSTWERQSDWFRSRRTLFLERFPDHLNGMARALLDKIERAPVVANERLRGAPLGLSHGDFHLDNLLFEKQVEPVFLDWNNPVKAAPAYNLVNLLFFMTSLENFDRVFDSYLGEFNELSGNSYTRWWLKRQLGSEFLRAFATSTCGVARWQPQSQRGTQMLEDRIRQINQAVGFWQRIDPDLFSFLY
jgi:thiamine kinase-like enzyme